MGRKLYVKITEVIQAEIEEVTEEDCIEYIYNLVNGTGFTMWTFIFRLEGNALACR